MRPFTLTDFSGGVSEQLPSDAFTDDAVAVARGFVLDGTSQIRTQWACQKVGTKQLTAVRGFAGRAQNYLVGIDNSGDVWWTRETVIAWTKVTGSTTGTPQPNVAYRFLCEVPRGAATHTARATLDKTNSDGTSDVEDTGTSETTFWASNGLLVNCTSDSPTSPPRDAFVLYESTPGVLAVDVYSNAAGDNDRRFPRMEDHASIPDQQVPTITNVMPHANVGVMWGDRLFLADVYWYGSNTEERTTTNEILDADGAVTSTTVSYTYATMNPLSSSGYTGARGTYAYTAPRRYSNAIWVSEAGFPYTFDNLSLDLPCSEDSRIVDMTVTDLGLLVYTTTAAGEDGLILLRGTPGAYTVERLRNLSAPRRSVEQHRPVGTFWQATGTYCFVDRLGGIWATQGDEVARLDGPASIDHRGGATDADHVASLGQYLFASHSGRMLCMRAFGESAGWTELLTPGWDDETPTAVHSMTVSGTSLYFIQGSTLYRFTCGDDDNRGQMPAGSNTDVFTLGTATVSVPTKDGGDFGRSQWHRVGVTLSGSGSARLVSVTVKAGPALTDCDEVVSVLDVPVLERSQFVAAAGVGFIVEGSILLRLRGDVSVESVTVWFTPGKRSW